MKIDEIYEKVRDYDIVLTADAPLADALNNRIEKSRIGEFAITPKILALRANQNREIADERKLFIKSIRETELSWKKVFHILENIFDCMKNTGNLRKILEYERFDNPETKKIIQILEETRNIYTEMENFKPDKEKSTAVIALHQFNELDKKVLPEDYEIIDLFQDSNQELPKFRIFGNITDILQTIREAVNRDNYDDIAIVINPESEYPLLLQSLFQSENIPFMLRMDFTEDEDLRNFLLILKSGSSEKHLRLRDVQPILSSFNIEISIEHNNKLLKNLEIRKLDKIKELLSNVRNSTFNDVLSEYEKMMHEEVSEVREVLEEINILGKTVSEEKINKLEYYLDSFDIKASESERGVLLASAKSTSFVDRSIILYLDMDSNWDRDISDKPWIDKGKDEKENLKNFELLIQNGERQYYIVRESEMGSKITPCLYLDDILEIEFETFSDLPHEKYSRRINNSRERTFDKQYYNLEVKPVKMISQSGLNKLVKCPRDYYFSKLIRMERNHQLELGSLFHDFAEFYVNHQKFVNNRGIQEFIELISREIKPFIIDFDLDVFKTIIRVGLKNIMKFLDGKALPDIRLDDYEKRSWGNYFEDHYGRDIEKGITELWFENPELCIKGKVDLLASENHLVDYKSGKKSSSRSIIHSSNLDLLKEDPNFQAILYILHHRENRPGEEIEFSFFHFLDNLEDVIMRNAKLEDDIVTVTYHPRTFSEQLSKRETFNYLIKGISENNNRRKTLERLNHSNYSKFFSEIELPHEYDKDKLLKSNLAHDYIFYSQKLIGKYKYVKKGCESSLKKLISFRERNYFKEDLDNFQSFLKKQIEKLNEYKKDRFPIGDLDIEKLDNRDLIIGDLYGTK